MLAVEPESNSGSAGKLRAVRASQTATRVLVRWLAGNRVAGSAPLERAGPPGSVRQLATLHRTAPEPLGDPLRTEPWPWIAPRGRPPTRNRAKCTDASWNPPNHSNRRSGAEIASEQHERQSKLEGKCEKRTENCFSIPIGYSSYLRRNFGLIALKLSRPPMSESYSSARGRRTTPSRRMFGFSRLVPSE